MMNDHRGPSGETLLFSCAGAAHCGQVANKATLLLAEDGVGKVFCTAAVSAGIPDKMARARRATRRVALDGCDDHCTRITLENAGLTVDLHVVGTDLDIDRVPSCPRTLVDARKMASAVLDLVGERV